MPIYEYQCSKCKCIKEELNSFCTEYHSTGCLMCLEPMKRIISASYGYVAGTNTPAKQKPIQRVEENDKQDFSACSDMTMLPTGELVNSKKDNT